MLTPSGKIGKLREGRKVVKDTLLVDLNTNRVMIFLNQENFQEEGPHKNFWPRVTSKFEMETRAVEL